MSWLFIVTMTKRNPKHNPRNKIIGICPLTGDKYCTDSTGHHHSIPIYANSIIEAEEKTSKYNGWRVSRVEMIGVGT